MNLDEWRKSQDPKITYSKLAKDLDLCETAIYRIIKYGCKSLTVANSIVEYTKGAVTHRDLESTKEVA